MSSSISSSEMISGGDMARSLTVFAALEGEGMASWTCFLVRSDMPGFRATRTELKMGMRASGAAELEFDNVFLPGWEEGVFPSQRALDEGGLASLEEERRLAYVAITRARRRCTTW